MKPVKAEDVLYQLRAIAMADVTKLVQIGDGTVELKTTAELPKPLRCAVASIEKSSSGIKVKFYDKLKALELLGKCLGLFDGSGQESADSPLLAALLEGTGEEIGTDDIPELQQAAAAGDDLVEQAESERPGRHHL